jgi:hypothetical protein
MTEHLRQDEFVDAIEQTLSASRQTHLQACAECQAAAESLRAVLHDVKNVEMPEPSPLFWNHFSDRVRQATAVETETPWWHPDAWLKPAAVIGAAAAAALLVIVLRPAPARTSTISTPDTETASLAMSPDDGSWGFVIGLASELDAADVSEVAKPKDGTADAMIAELTPAQRRALAQLLKDEIGEQ